jgi:hypothetical protein
LKNVHQPLRLILPATRWQEFGAMKNWQAEQLWSPLGRFR